MFPSLIFRELNKNSDIKNKFSRKILNYSFRKTRTTEIRATVVRCALFGRAVGKLVGPVLGNAVLIKAEVLVGGSVGTGAGTGKRVGEKN